VCPEQKLIIEIDGGRHAANVRRDNQRTNYLNRKGWRVIRFWNHEVLNEREAVLTRILSALELPSPRPSPQRGEGETRQRPLPKKKKKQRTATSNRGKRVIPETFPLPQGRGRNQDQRPFPEWKGESAHNGPEPRKKGDSRNIPYPLRREGQGEG
jgi:hypothetical protein